MAEGLPLHIPLSPRSISNYCPRHTLDRQSEIHTQDILPTNILHIWNFPRNRLAHHTHKLLQQE